MAGSAGGYQGVVFGPNGPVYVPPPGEVIGGHDFPQGFDNVRDYLESRYPGELLLEFVNYPFPERSPDSMPVVVFVPQDQPCPEGTY